jgi:uncharacterized protein YjbI with pentapeptide repeats
MLSPMAAAISPAAGLRAIGSLAVVVSGLVQLRHRRKARPAGPPTSSASGLQLARRRLSQQDLHGQDLRRANLRGARLRDLDLSERDLTGADLASACFDGSSLARARFDGADLSWASMRRCDLRGAALPGSQLLEADLRLALLHGADLTRTSALGTVDWRGARAGPTTRWPTGFDPRSVGIVIEREAQT